MKVQARKVTGMILDLVEQGVLDPMTVLQSCLSYMSEAEVADMAYCEGFIEEEEEEEEEG